MTLSPSIVCNATSSLTTDAKGCKREQLLSTQQVTAADAARHLTGKPHPRWETGGLLVGKKCHDASSSEKNQQAHAE
jgi:hypothetical protein